MSPILSISDIQTARKYDAKNPLRKYRNLFHIPKHDSKNNEKVLEMKESIYLCGNSLGLQPKRTRFFIEQELKKWEENGVDSQLSGKEPWVDFDDICVQQMARIVGAKEGEVVLMNSLTVNLHLMLTAMYRPTDTRYKVVIEEGAFPSDEIAIKSQITLKKLDPSLSLIHIKPREGSQWIEEEDIFSLIDSPEGDEIALILLGGVNYLTGQMIDMAAISNKAKEKGIITGLDLAHAVGNVKLELHNWGIDFAVWCTYKYLNSGPGGIGGAFIHERYAKDFSLPRMSGWWAHNKSSRFLMKSSLDLQQGAFGFQVSNPPILCLAALRASLEIYDEVGMDTFVEKSNLLTEYMESLLLQKSSKWIRIITPSNSKRGCQLTLTFLNQINTKHVLQHLKTSGVICDLRQPNCLRVAPNPFYTSYEDVWWFVEILNELFIK